MKELESFISHWGYVAVFLGTLVEGEVTMVISGFLASQNIFDMRAVILWGAIGGFLGDQFFFVAGWLSHRFRLLKRLERNVRYRKARRVIRKYGAYIILFSRYLVGMRMAFSFALGAMRVPFRKFSLLNFFSAFMWAPTVAFLGYALGAVALRILGDVKKYETALIAILLAIALLGFFLKKLLERLEERRLD